jgi:HD-GYP domain-containing protein (c-di-GMP phosphodiesterase class II)
VSLDCDHAGTHSGATRYVRETTELRLVLVCDQCGDECGELRRVEYAPHGRRFIRDLAELVARQLRLEEPRVARIRLAAMLCDVGRGEIPPEILNKRGKLTPQERATVRRQPELSVSLLGYHGFGDIREWVASRRERPDGRGYPRGLSGEQIPLEAKILGVVDAYAAMTSDRPHRRALDHGQATLELLDHAGTQFDATVVKAFVRATSRRVPYTGLAAA